MYWVCVAVLGNVVSCSQDKASQVRETMTALRGTTKGCGSPEEQVIHSSAFRHVISPRWRVGNIHKNPSIQAYLYAQIRALSTHILIMDYELAVSMLWWKEFLTGR